MIQAFSPVVSNRVKFDNLQFSTHNKQTVFSEYESNPMGQKQDLNRSLEFWGDAYQDPIKNNIMQLNNSYNNDDFENCVEDL